jgi:hypothetical protein
MNNEGSNHIRSLSKNDGREATHVRIFFIYSKVVFFFFFFPNKLKWAIKLLFLVALSVLYIRLGLIQEKAQLSNILQPPSLYPLNRVLLLVVGFYSFDLHL